MYCTVEDYESFGSQKEHYHHPQNAISTTNSLGRFGNQFIRNIFVHLLAKTYQLSALYSHAEDMASLGLPMYSGTTTYTYSRKVIDDDVFKMILGKTRPTFNIELDLYKTFFQSKDHSLYLNSYLHESEQQRTIRASNPFKDRYGANDEVFVHLRLGDAEQWSPGYEYFHKALSRLSFSKGYLSSDSKDHANCQRLLKEFPTLQWNPHEEVIPTIQFASTCKHLVLSHGSFSAIMGHLAFDSDIYYAPYPKVMWHGDMFSIPGWKKVE